MLSKKYWGKEISSWFGITMLAAVSFILGYGDNANATDVKFNKFVEEISINGDFRLRYENFDRDTAGQVDRKRERIRLRLNTNFKLPSHVQAKFTFASGTGEQVSTNQSFDNLSAQKPLWIDKAYLVWDPIEGLKLQGGRMAQPLWTQYSSDVVWDSDFNPEGFSQKYGRFLGIADVWVAALQMVVDEDSGANGTANAEKDQWLLAEQVGAEFKIPFNSRIKLSYANYNWINETLGTFGQTVTNDGNRRSGTTLLNNFNVNEYTGNIGTWLFNKPLSIQGTYVKNTGAKESLTPKEDTGYQFGGIFNKVSGKGTWEVAYFNKHVRSDATVADISDSDFGDGGTNREGHIVWIAYGLNDFTSVSVKYFDVGVINETLSPGPEDINRAQFDVVVKF